MAFKSMILVLFLILYIFALLSAQPINGFTVELIHPNAHSNPYRNPSNNRFDWIRQAYNESLSRAAAIQSRLSSFAKFKTDVKPIYGGYVMKYSIGTPPFETYGIVDTGSDITWTQCEPCINCFSQGLPVFDPKDSKSYKKAACDSDACSLYDTPQCSKDNVCQYEESYADHSYTTGDVATDTLTIGDASFKNVVFGCGHINNVTFRNGTSGIFGLGGTYVSIVKQLENEIDGKFSYCLSSNSNSKSHISFGIDAIVKGAGAVSTHFFTHEDEFTFYWLTLESMSVNRKKFLVKQSPTSDIGGMRGGVGTTQTGFGGNIIIDSGTTLTLLAANVFDSLKSELMKQIPATPIDDPKGQFGLCYSTSKKIEVPKIVAHFSGADVELSPVGAFQEVEEGISCLTILRNYGISIFGNLSEVDHLVGFDWATKTVTFKPADCSKF